MTNIKIKTGEWEVELTTYREFSNLNEERTFIENSINSAVKNNNGTQTMVNNFNSKTYTVEEVAKLLEIQRENCWFVVEKELAKKNIDNFQITIPEPKNWRK